MISEDLIAFLLKFSPAHRMEIIMRLLISFDQKTRHSFQKMLPAINEIQNKFSDEERISLGSEALSVMIGRLSE